MPKEGCHAKKSLRVATKKKRKYITYCTEFKE